MQVPAPLHSTWLISQCTRRGIKGGRGLSLNLSLPGLKALLLPGLPLPPLPSTRVGTWLHCLQSVLGLPSLCIKQLNSVFLVVHHGQGDFCISDPERIISAPQMLSLVRSSACCFLTGRTPTVRDLWLNSLNASCFACCRCCRLLPLSNVTLQQVTAWPLVPQRPRLVS